MLAIRMICIVTVFVSHTGAPARPPARAVEPAAAQPPPPRALRRTRILVPALGVPPRRAAVQRQPTPPRRPAIAMRTHRGIQL